MGPTHPSIKEFQKGSSSLDQVQAFPAVYKLIGKDALRETDKLKGGERGKSEKVP